MVNGIIKPNTKKLILPKSKYGLVNNIVLESCIMRIDSNKYDISIVERDNTYIIKKNSLSMIHAYNCDNGVFIGELHFGIHG